MKAIRFTRYGSPDVLKLVDVEKPTPAADQVLIKVVAASANPLDWHLMRADPFLVRLSNGFFRPKQHSIGADIAGVIEAVGKDIKEFKVGDAVFGDIGAGSFAEYALAKEKHIVFKPNNISFEEAAAIPVAGITALQGLRDKKALRPGQHVLINGASGGIGTYAVQIAKSMGLQVTGVCSTRNLELVKSLGADHVIDYTKTNFTEAGQTYDLILDNVANHPAKALRRALKPDGVGVSAGFSTTGRMIMTGLFGSRGGQPVSLLMANIKKEDIQYLADLLASGKVKSVIDQCYPLAKAADAIRYLETSRARGKVIVTVNPA